MPTPQSQVGPLPTIHPVDLSATSVACPQLLTPPPERDEVEERQLADGRSTLEDGSTNCAVDDNTAAGMSLMLEDSMYQSYDSMSANDITVVQTIQDKEKTALGDGITQSEKDTAQPHSQTNVLPSTDAIIYQINVVNTDSMEEESPDNSIIPSLDPASQQQTRIRSSDDQGEVKEDIDSSTDGHQYSRQSAQAQSAASQQTNQYTQSPTPPPLISENRTPHPTTPYWDFTATPLSTSYPSSLLRPGAKFTGTQQSDRQIYNVDVDILTVDMPQSTLTGYLRICGLTEDHPTLTTFFSGEIIGSAGSAAADDDGEEQKYSFQTKHASWGATDKTDLLHWARFPSWRPLVRFAKMDLGFTYPIPTQFTAPTRANSASSSIATPAKDPSSSSPVPQDAWWQQENIFMRWKEWFLVPDHRVRSIAGASFEGFYYICFNQVSGTVSGIYFHAKSEKYQQLELKHVYDKGVCPSMEFR